MSKAKKKTQWLRSMRNLDLGFKIRISDLQSNAKPENGFKAKMSLLGLTFFPFFCEIRKRI